MSEFTPESQAAARKLWVEALRSGDYSQGVDMLRTDSGAFCCLGVACDLAVREGVIERYAADAGVPPLAVQGWLGLTEETGRLKEAIAVPDPLAESSVYDCLIELNDVLGLTFAEIADIIESGGVRVVGEED